MQLCAKAKRHPTTGVFNLDRPDFVQSRHTSASLNMWPTSASSHGR